jgi:hypothetical protein
MGTTALSGINDRTADSQIVCVKADWIWSFVSRGWKAQPCASPSRHAIRADRQDAGAGKTETAFGQILDTDVDRPRIGRSDRARARYCRTTRLSPALGHRLDRRHLRTHAR